MVIVDMNEDQYCKLVKGFALYHLIMVIPLMLPVFSNSFLNFLDLLHAYIRLPGKLPSNEISGIMFVNLFACIGFIWALWRFNEPSSLVGVYEGWTMLLVSLIVIFYVYMGYSPLWLIIPLVDIPGGILHIIFSKTGGRK